MKLSEINLMSDYLPINLKISDFSCLVVGGGKVALRKGKTLIKAGAKVTFIAPHFVEPICELAKDIENVSLIESNFNLPSLAEYQLVIAATDEAKVNQLVSNMAEKERVLVNVVDEPSLCRFITPAIVNRGPLSVAISSQGAAPVLARMLKEKIELGLPENLGKLLENIAKGRSQVIAKYSEFSKRKQLWESYFENILDWKKSQFSSVARNQLSTEEFSIESLESFSSKAEGKLYLMDGGNEKTGSLSLDFVGACQKTDRLVLLSEMKADIRALVRKDVLDYRVELAPLEFFTHEHSLLVDIIKWVDRGEKVVVYSSGHTFETEQKVLTKIMQSRFGEVEINLVFTVKS